MNEAQVEAITARVPNVLVSAGAGSGKTSVLTERYFHLLDDKIDGRNVRLDEILTLTFTRKAAQEMRERIARKLAQEGRVHERRELARAPIGTIHSFCESVLREHALDAGIDPHFRMLDEAESATLRENALDSIFEDLWNGTQEEREEIGRLLLDFPQRRLRSALLGIFGHARTRGIEIEQIAPLPPAPLDAPARDLCTAVEDLLALPGTAKWQQNLAQVETAYAQIKPIVISPEASSWDDYLAVTDALSDLTPSGGPKGTAKACRDAIKATAQGWLGAVLDRIAAPFLSAFCRLLHQFAQAYQTQKESQGLLDFEDLLVRTRDLLLSDNGAASRLRQRFRQVMVDEFQDTNPLQFSIVHALQGDGHLFMVGDVKQAIYRFIGSDIHVFLQQEQRILDMAHDGVRIPMQTNYRTRPEILEPLNGIFSRLWRPENTADGFTFEPLSAGRDFIPKNEPSIELAFWPGEEGPVAALRDREANWIARRILQLTGANDSPALQVTHGGKGADVPLVAKDATFGDMIVLFRASTDIPLYEDALRKAGIPFYVVSGRGFYGTREVQDLLFLLRTLENPTDDFSLAVVLRSPLVGVSDDTLYWLTRDWEEWVGGNAYPTKGFAGSRYGGLWTNVCRCEQLPAIPEEEQLLLQQLRRLIRDLQPEMSAGQPLDLIDMILARTDYANILLASPDGDQRYANVQKLREVATTFQARGIFDLSDFQRYLTQLTTQAPREASAPLDVEGSNVVRLMTVHASKGLEAPVVFLADCGRDPNDVRDTVLFSPEGLACQIPTPADEWVKPTTYQRVQERVAQEERREAERLLYVALTRAKEHLICCGSTKYPEVEKCTSYADTLAYLLDLTGPVAADTAIPVTFEETAYPVRVWSPASLRACEQLQPPAQASTLWEEYSEAILHGGELPVLTDAALVEQFMQISDRLQPLPHRRREGPIRIGVHRALNYRTCPRQYWLNDVLQGERLVVQTESSMQVGPTRDEDDDVARMDGTSFGKTLHLVMQQVDFREPLPAQLPSILERIAPELPQEVSPSDHARLDACLHRMMAVPIYPDLQRATAMHRELRFLAREGEAFIPGIIDLLVQVDDAWWVVDYKTGMPSANHLRQVAIYALGVGHTLDIQPSRAVLLYLDSDGPRIMRNEAVTPELLAEARQIIRDAGDGVRNDDYHPTPGRHCHYCPYTGACPEALLPEQGTLAL